MATKQPKKPSKAPKTRQPKKKSEAELDAELAPAELLVKRMGRPSKYKPEYNAAIIAWFMVEKYAQFTTDETIKYNKDGVKTSESRRFKMIPADLPTLQGFARNIGVSYDTMRGWANDLVDPDAETPVLRYPEFSVAYNIAKELQKEFLIDNGLKGNYPPASYIFTAKNITDMTDKTIVETKDTDYGEKQDALSTFFNSIRQHAQSKPRDTGADEATGADIQE